MNIGRSIKIAQAKKGMRGKDLAKKLGVTQSTVSLMTIRETASGAMLKKLADVFEMSVSEFVELGED